MIARRDPYAIAGLVCLPFVLLHLTDGLWKTNLASGPLIGYWAYDVTVWVFLATVLMGTLHHLTAIVPRDYGLSADLGIKDILYVLLLPLLSLFFIGFAVLEISNRILHYPQGYFSYTSVLSPLGPVWIIGTIYLSITAGIWESIFFIGLPWLWFNRSGHATTLRKRAFGFGSALLFAAGHWENGVPNVLAVFSFQILAVWWYFELQTLWPVIGAHFLIDLYYFWPTASI